MNDDVENRRVLIIEDEAPIRRFLRVVLEGAGYSIEEAARGRDGLQRAATGAPDAILLDLGLPDIDGKTVISGIRAWSPVPILILSVRSGESEIVAALDAGADDYVTKPFATGELLARLRALLRRRSDHSNAQPIIALGPITIDLAGRTVRRGDSDIGLTRKEFDVLAVLAQNAGRLLTHGQILTTVWGPTHVRDTHYLRIAIGHLRDKLGDSAAQPTLIFTEPGVGYRAAGG